MEDPEQYKDVAVATLSFDIVHPNSAGHRLIAELNYKTLMTDKKQ